MSLQIIKSIQGKDEYVLLPMIVYKALHNSIDKKLKQAEANSDYVPFLVEDYVDNPVSLARIKAHISQKELAKRMKVTQAYISKVERQEKVSLKLLTKVKDAIKTAAN